MVKPRALHRGSRIAVIAPASPFERDEFDRGVQELRRLGFDPVYDESVFARHRAFLAGPAEVRARAFLSAWRDPDVSALIAVRGGYGSAHLLPFLKDDELRRTPKALIGYSDVTALLNFLTIGCGIVGFHGPMLDRRLSRPGEGYDERSFLGALCAVKPLGELVPPSLEAIRPGDAAGVLFGGNLTQLVSSLGTPFAFDPPPGFVLFVEEVGERPYRLDRMMTQLAQAGIMARAAAIVVGELPKCDEPGGSPSGRGVMADFLAEFRGPVVAGFPSGHTNGPAMTLPLGVRCRVVADPRPRLIVEEAAVA